jgi:hypothetical protein
MIRKSLTLTILAGLVLGTCALGVSPLAAQDAKAPEKIEVKAHVKTKDALQTQEMPPMGPPPEMKQIAAMEGVYDVVFKYKMDPAQSWVTTNGLCTIKNVLGGAAQQMTWQGEMLGMNFEGRGMTCYDRESKMWQNTWVDNMSARISYYTGTMQDGNFVFEGEDVMEGKPVQARNTTMHITDKGFESKMEMSMDGGQTYMTWATAVYTKR